MGGLSSRVRLPGRVARRRQRLSEATRQGPWEPVPIKPQLNAIQCRDAHKPVAGHNHRVQCLEEQKHIHCVSQNDRVYLVEIGIYGTGKARSGYKSGQGYLIFYMISLITYEVNRYIMAHMTSASQSF